VNGLDGVPRVCELAASQAVPRHQHRTSLERLRMAMPRPGRMVEAGGRQLVGSGLKPGRRTVWSWPRDSVGSSYSSSTGCSPGRGQGVASWPLDEDPSPPVS
jgi:hypothetical protein